MTKRRKSKAESHNDKSYAVRNTTSSRYGGGNRFAVFDFADEDGERKAKESSSKYIRKSPKRPIDKYFFLDCFAGGSTADEIDLRNEALDVEVVDTFREDRGQAMAESPGSMMKSLSISLDTPDIACSSRGNNGFRNTGRKKKNKHCKHVLCLESEDDGMMDLQTPIRLDLAVDRGSLEEVSSPRRSDVIDCEEFVIVSPAYAKFGKLYYTNCCLRFSSSSIRLEGSPLHVKRKPHHLDWSTFDIVRIEHQPCQSAKVNVLNFHLRIKDTSLDETCNGNSGILDLEFVVDENQWYKKQKEIISLDVKYEDAWETIISECDSSELVDEIVYPEGNPDAVFISSRDVELLRPMAFLNDTIIDFYIKYLITSTKPEEQHRFHFFNTFFFQKLADIDQSTSRDGREAFQRIYKWTKNIDLFHKDFIFIPVNFSLHWSLIVICHPGELPNLEDNDSVDSSMGPSILHMDSIRGSHRGLENRIRRYLCEEWRERHGEQDANKFMSLRFNALQLPQQENFSDCGLFLLHYAELFLKHTANLSNPKYSDFLNEAWFLPAEVSLKKRDHIRKLISNLAKEKAMKDPQVTGNEKNISSVVNEGDSSVEIVNRNDVKEACDGIKFNSGTHHRIKRQQSFDDTIELENGRQPVSEGDSSVEIVNRRDVKETCDGIKFNSGTDHRIKRHQSFDDTIEPENGRQLVNNEGLHQSVHLLPISQPSVMKMPMEIEATEKHSSPTRDLRSRSEADEDKNSTPLYCLIGQIEVPIPATVPISPVIFDLDDDEHPVNEITSTPEKMKEKEDYYSVLSEEKFADCIVEDSEEESGRVGVCMRQKRRMISCTD